MNVLVTGGAGYIGSHTCVELLEKGYGVVVIDNLVNSSAKSLERVEQITGKSLDFYQNDVRDRDAMERIFSKHDIDCVIHFAGLPFEMPPDNIQSTSGLQFEIQPDDVQRIAIPVLVVFNDESSMTSSIVWVAQLYWEKNELNFVVDDETGMILSAYFYLYNNDAKANGRSDETAPADADETARRLGEALCRSYGFENVTVEAETGSLGDETGLLIAETDYNAEYFAECNIRFALNGETKCRMSLSFEGQNWHFGV